MAITVITKATKEFIDASGRRRKVKGNMDIELTVDADGARPRTSIRSYCFQAMAISVRWSKRCSGRGVRVTVVLVDLEPARR